MTKFIICSSGSPPLCTKLEQSLQESRFYGSMWRALIGSKSGETCNVSHSSFWHHSVLWASWAQRSPTASGVVGPTFPNRLWCVLEVFFVFELRAGQGSCCFLLDLCDKEQDNSPEIRFSGFDACKAQCAHPEDRDYLLGIIESSFGSNLEPFNKYVRSLRLG
jgi:hypothetical protein